MKTYKKKIESIKSLREIQGTLGNWDYDSYMTGMYNGLELALSVIENREPKFKTARERITLKIKKHFLLLIKKILKTEINLRS